MTRRTILCPILIAVVLASLPGRGYTQSTDAILDGGIRAFEAGDFQRAKQIFSELVRRDPSAANLGYLAMAEAADGELDQAISYFQKSIQLGDAGQVDPMVTLQCE
jgi:Tfp pilus assembly protein PilF